MENTTTPSAYTPGPWTYVALDPKFAEFAAFRINGNHMYESVADVFYREGDDEADANARLIAAAPNLLELARNVADCCWSESEREVLTKAARELIATVDEKTPPTPLE